MNKSALVLFALSPELEVKRKPVLHHAGLDLSLYKSLFANAEWKGFWQNYSLLKIGEKRQRGETFGSRFCNAIELAFSNGHENLVLIGNDAPEINSAIISTAFKTVKEGKSAIVTSQRGGACLIAISRQHYNREKWLNLPWQSSNLAEALILELKDVVVLGNTIEIHAFSDVQMIIRRRNISTKLIIKLVELFQKHVVINFEWNSSLYSQVIPSHDLRGPPSLVF